MNDDIRKEEPASGTDEIKNEPLNEEQAPASESEETTVEVEVDEDGKEEEKEQAEDGKKKKLSHEEKKHLKKIEELSSQVDKLNKDKEALSTKLEKEKGDYVRLMAEFDNFRRRSAEEKLKLAGSASKDTIKGLLPVLDDCERALELLEASSDEAAKEGTHLIYDKLISYLKSKGLEKIEAKGAKFDTDFHEAVAQFPVEDPAMKGCVYDVVSTGYLLNGEVLRYAKVVVGV